MKEIEVKARLRNTDLTIGKLAQLGCRLSEPVRQIDTVYGGREGNETPIETALREVKEEFGFMLDPRSIVWQKEYPAMVEAGRTAYFFVAKLDMKDADRIKFGNEGQKWSFMEVSEFLKRDDVVPHLKVRLGDYLNTIK